MWKNIVQPGRNTYDNIWRVRIACSIPKATNTHSGCVILIAFPLQQWLQERTSILSYTYIALLRFSVKYLDPLETSGKYLTPCYTIQSSTFCPHTRYCVFLRFAQQPANIDYTCNMNRLVFTMESTAFSVRYEQNNLYMKCRLILLFKGLCEGSGCWSPATHCAGPGSFLRTDNMRFVVNVMALRQVSRQFFVVPTSSPYSYFISVLLLSEKKHVGEARKPSSKAMFFRIS